MDAIGIYNILNEINNVVLYIIGIPFTLQIIYLLLSWVPKKKFKKSEKINRICILIPAHNESAVIYDTVRLLKEKQTYPKEMFDIYVVADNCTDNTAELAANAGAKVLVHNDPDPKTHIVSYAIKYGYEKILETGIDYAFSIRFDADNHCNDEFLSLMNDAFNSGCQIARPYESALNMTQNNFTKACGLYYIFDSRFSSRVRERLHIDAHVNGPGSLTDFNIIREIKGYDTTSITEDTEFCFKRMLDGYKCHYVEDAVVYEDLPSSFKDTFNRNRRIAAGNVRLLGKYTIPMLLKFCMTLRFSFIEQILTYMFNIICVILCTWLPAFYIYAFIFLGSNGYYDTGVARAAGVSGLGFNDLLLVVILALVFLFATMGILQGFVLAMLEYKKMGAKNRKELMSGVFLFPWFTIVYCITMCIGAFTKPKWNKINRNKDQSNS